VQEGIESQAIDRVNRIGQKKNVHVYQLIAENTVESKVLEIQERKKVLIKEVCNSLLSCEFLMLIRHNVRLSPVSKARRLNASKRKRGCKVSLLSKL
jgi:SWI/SNF-related matrix-associated actin-dependent regulator of chromatin subfamily A3